MRTLSRRDLLASGLACLGLIPIRATAAPTAYKVLPGQASISFTFSFSGARQTGTAPLATADLRIDPAALARSTADVRADLTRARTGLVFATDAMKSDRMLHTARWPEARFRSTSVQTGPGGRISDGAAILGQLTLRDQTQPIRFDAGLFRPAGSDATTLDTLEVRLSGRINRHSFGISGYPDLVKAQVGIDVRAVIKSVRA